MLVFILVRAGLASMVVAYASWRMACWAGFLTWYQLRRARLTARGQVRSRRLFRCWGK